MVTSERHQKALLGGLERLVGLINIELISAVPKLLMGLYQADILDEDTITQWGTHVSKKYVDKDTSKKVRKASEPFLKVRLFLFELVSRLTFLLVARRGWGRWWWRWWLKTIWLLVIVDYTLFCPWFCIESMFSESVLQSICFTSALSNPKIAELVCVWSSFVNSAQAIFCFGDLAGSDSTQTLTLTLTGSWSKEVTFILWLFSGYSLIKL